MYRVAVHTVTNYSPHLEHFNLCHHSLIWVSSWRKYFAVTPCMLNVYKHLLFELMGFVILPPINWWSSHYPVTVACMLRNKSCCSVPSCTLICSYQAADTILLFPSTKHELESVMQIARTCFPCYSAFRQLVKCLLSNFDIFYEVVRMSNP